MTSGATPLKTRSDTLVTIILAAMAVMAVSPFFDAIALNWPIRVGEPRWRYDTISMIVSTGPQVVILFGVIALIATLIGSRRMVRFVAVVLGVVALSHVVLLPLMMLDFLQLRRIIVPTKAAAFRMVAYKAVAFGVVVTILAALISWRAWGASASTGGGSTRRQKGDGLVVGSR